MTNPTILRKKNRIDDLFRKIDGLSGDIELQAHWSRYMCVLIAGYLETAAQTIYSEYAKQRSDPNVANYVSRALERFTNANTAKIIDLTSSFSPEWAVAVKEEVEGEIKSAVDSIYAHRNLIAHGRDTSISYVQLREWYKSAVKLIDLLEAKCDYR